MVPPPPQMYWRSFVDFGGQLLDVYLKPVQMSDPHSRRVVFFEAFANAHRFTRRARNDRQRSRLNEVHCYCGRCSSGERNQSLTCEPVSACRALRRSASRSTPGLSFIASSRRRSASLANCFSRTSIGWLIRRRSGIWANSVVGRRPNLGSDFGTSTILFAECTGTFRKTLRKLNRLNRRKCLTALQNEGRRPPRCTGQPQSLLHSGV